MSTQGSKAARTGAGQGGLNRTGLIPVTAGQPITFQVWAKISASPSWAGVGLDFLNSSGAEISEINLQITATVVHVALGNTDGPGGRNQCQNLDLEEWNNRQSLCG